MISNVAGFFNGVVLDRGADHVCSVTLVNLYVCSKGRAECYYLHVVSPRTPFGHTGQVIVKNAVDLLCRGSGRVLRGRKCTGILTFWISADASAREYLQELLIIFRVFLHVRDNLGTYYMMLVLSAVELIGESVE